MRAIRVLVVVALLLAPMVGVPMVSAPAAETTTAMAPTQSKPVSESPGTIKQPLNNSTAYLAIKQNAINTTTTDTVTLDIGGSVVVSTREIVQKFSISRFDAAYQNASDETQQDIINDTLDRVANQTAALRARQASAIEAYNSDELSTQAFLRELAIIAAKASQLRGFVVHVAQYAGDSTQTRVRTLEKELSALAGPVRTRIQSALQGDPDAPTRYFIETSARSVILATIDGSTYVREVYLSAARTAPNSTESVSFEEAYNTVTEKLYPDIPLTNSTINGRGDIYKFSFGHSYGRLTVYVDNATGNVFSEQQILELDDTHTAFGQAKTNGSFALTTRVTHPGGYMLVRLTNPANGAPRNGTVAINGTIVGVTGGEDDPGEDGEAGVLYILQPREQVTITATVNGKTKSVTVGNASSPVSTSTPMPTSTPPSPPVPTPQAPAVSLRKS